jgi:hypothetical protein
LRPNRINSGYQPADPSQADRPDALSIGPGPLDSD